MKYNSKGMTLIEVLVALSIFTIVSSIVYGIYISSTKSLSKTEIKSMLQTEAQMIQYKLTPLGMESKGIGLVLDKNKNEITDSSDFLEITSVEFIGDKKYTFKLEDTKLILKHGEMESVLSSNVSSFKIKPYSSLNYDGLNLFTKASSLDIEVILNKTKGFNDIKYPISTTITFRNK